METLTGWATSIVGFGALCIALEMAASPVIESFRRSAYKNAHSQNSARYVPDEISNPTPIVIKPPVWIWR